MKGITMNKKMKELYAQFFFLGEWVDELYAQIKTDPDAHIKEQEVMKACGMKMVAITEEIDKERKAYMKQPLWKQLFAK
jgi:hypothetical protein